MSGPRYYSSKSWKKPNLFLNLEIIMDAIANQIEHTNTVINANLEYSKYLQNMIKAYQQVPDNSQPELPNDGLT